MVDTNGTGFGLKDWMHDKYSLSVHFLASKAGQQEKELKETSKHTSDKVKHAIFLENTKDLN